MENNNVRTMEYIGTDDWSRPVFKCVETEQLFKDVTLGSNNPELYSCGNDFYGEPGFPIKNDLEIHFKNMPKQTNPEDKFNYQLLSRLQMDCDYYLGNGDRNARHLWAENEKEQIEKMKELHNSFADDAKPEWLTFDQILEYEKLMINSK
ncbi:LPD11 domain-containing protein [Bacillus cereus]|uniref:LPD11 domain-containing protein n=1 Tax=Bacillus cereus TaxID=1396 RepID=UPI0015954F55|nr:LPD11 domain-containing protein [Bacillus cereus]